MPKYTELPVLEKNVKCTKRLLSIYKTSVKYKYKEETIQFYLDELCKITSSGSWVVKLI